jgi:hypothetical protein
MREPEWNGKGARGQENRGKMARGKEGQRQAIKGKGLKDPMAALHASKQ